VSLGLGKKADVDLVYQSWPDGAMQCELNVTSNEKLPLALNNCKTGGYPALFTWNGERFVCLGEFLGVGGLVSRVAPGVYIQPDRDEAVAIIAEQLRPEHGVFRLSVTEPIGEVVCLDHLILIEPLPWQAMPAFPFPAGYTRAASAAHEFYLREYQTGWLALSSWLAQSRGGNPACPLRSSTVRMVDGTCTTGSLRQFPLDQGG
jgi:hypothetical protein